MNTYRHVFAACCPANGETIIYGLQLCSTERIMVEDIRSACNEIAIGYQEDIAKQLLATFKCRVQLRAQHQGVEVVTVLGDDGQQPAAEGVNYAWLLANTDRFARD